MTADWWPARCHVTESAQHNDCPQSTTLNGLPAITMTDPAGIPLTADQEFQAGFTCNGMHATPTTPLPFTCLASQFGSTLTKVPAPGTENDDHNPPRIAPRNLFDLAIGDDNLFKADRYKWSLQLTAINLTNNVRAVQLPVNLQRHALRDAARDDSADRLPLLTVLRRKTKKPPSTGRLFIAAGMSPRCCCAPEFPFPAFPGRRCNAASKARPPAAWD